MRSFLVCVVHIPQSTPNMQLKVYPLERVTSPDEVTYPDNTVGFAFAEANSADEIYKNFIVFTTNNNAEFGRIKLRQKKKYNKVYLVGHKVTLEGKTYVKNSRTGTRIPFVEDEGNVVVPE